MIHLLMLILGLIMGSFLNVLIPRLHAGEAGIVTGRSKCESCGKTLSIKELFPLLSFLIQKGKCLHCKKQISYWNPIIELTSAMAFLWISFKFENMAEMLLYAILIWVFIYIFFHDLKHQEIHDAVLIPAILVSFIFSFYLGDPLDSLLGSAVGILFFGIQFLASKGKWIGSGDILIGAFLGMTLGWQFTLVAIFIAYLSASIIGILLMILGKAKAKTALPFGPFLIFGSIIAFEYGENLLNFYLNL